MTNEAGGQTTALTFPQYLWRIGNQGGVHLLRRGHDCNEPMQKFLRKDVPRIGHRRRDIFPFGVYNYCDLSDRAFYSENHPWDWLNE